MCWIELSGFCVYMLINQIIENYSEKVEQASQEKTSIFFLFIIVRVYNLIS